MQYAVFSMWIQIHPKNLKLEFSSFAIIFKISKNDQFFSTDSF